MAQEKYVLCDVADNFFIDVDGNIEDMAFWYEEKEKTFDSPEEALKWASKNHILNVVVKKAGINFDDYDEYI